METIKIDKRIEAEERGLNYIETTIGSNGYPESIKGAIIGFDTFKQAEDLADELGLEVQAFHKKDGWQLWGRSGNKVYSSFVNSAEDYGDDYSEEWVDNEEDFMEQTLEILDSFKGNTRFLLDDLEHFIKNRKEIWEEINCAGENSIVITHEGQYFDTIPRESMSWSHDTNNYIIGIV